MEQRKKDHINLALNSQVIEAMMDRRFLYEPMLASHPNEDTISPMNFLGKRIKVPIWISSMTGGTKLAGHINRNLARACNEFGMGMGLGSCRIILDDDKFFDDFNLRSIIGDDLPFYANLGIAQIHKSLQENKVDRISGLVSKLKCDGLIIHVNPLQEWLQEEGDKIEKPPIEIISDFINKFDYPLIVKEVGQGMGPESLKALMTLPLSAIEFAAFGGTNFAKLELERRSDDLGEFFEPISKLGHSAEDMVEFVNNIDAEELKCKEVIISGGIKNFLDGYYLINRIKFHAVYGQASSFLKYAQDSYDSLRRFVSYQIKGLALASSYLKINNVSNTN